MSISLVLHALAAVIWVGGMFFAHLILRPSVAPLEPSVRLPLWSRVLGRFFLWVWLSVVVLLATGFMLVSSFGGLAATGEYIHIMMGIGVLMMLIFTYLYFLPWRGFRKAVASEDWPRAARDLGVIRWLVTVNLILGLLNVAIATGGSFVF
jgi:uncharacterized membrane protein